MSDDLIDAVVRIVGDHCPRDGVAHYARDRFHARLWSALADAGLTTVSVPEGRGGSGGSVADALEIIEVVGRFAGAVPIAETGLLAGHLLASAGWDVPPGPLAVVAPSRAQLSTVRRADGTVVVDGVLRNVAWLTEATEFVMLCRHAEQHLVCRLPVAGLDIRAGLNMAGEGRDTVTFAWHAVPPDSVREVDAAVTRADLMVRGAASRVALMSGALRRVEELTVRYAGERVQFGRAINQFQAAQHRLARLAEEARLVRTALRRLTADAELSPADVAAAKSVATPAADAAVAEAHQLHGAIGITMEYQLNHFTRRIRSWRNEYGTSTDWNDWLGERLDAADDVWTALAGS